jgi:hypothetical protein
LRLTTWLQDRLKNNPPVAETEAAASKIQAVHRGKKARKQQRDGSDGAEPSQELIRKHSSDLANGAISEALQNLDGDAATAITSSEDASAATKIQAVHRGKRGRKRQKQAREDAKGQSAAATKIQSRHRGKAQRKQGAKAAPTEDANGQSAAATKIQSQHRGKAQHKQGAKAAPTPTVKPQSMATIDDLCAKVSSKMVDHLFNGFQEKVVLGKQLTSPRAKWKPEEPPPEMVKMQELEEVKMQAKTRAAKYAHTTALLARAQRLEEQMKKNKVVEVKLASTLEINTPRFDEGDDADHQGQQEESQSEGAATSTSQPGSKDDGVARSTEEVENARKAKLLVKKLQKDNEDRRRKIMERKVREEDKLRKDLEKREAMRKEAEVTALKAKQELLMQRRKELDKKKALRAQLDAPQMHSKIPKPLYKKMEDNFEKQVLMPELEKRKQALREIREKFEKGPDDIEDHARAYEAKKKQHQQRQMMKQKQEMLKQHAENDEKKPYKGKFQADVRAQQKERKKAMEEKSKEKELRVARQQQYANQVRLKHKPVVDERKREELVELQQKHMSKRSTQCVHVPSSKLSPLDKNARPPQHPKQKKGGGRNIRVNPGLPPVFSANNQPLDRDNGGKYSSSKSEPTSGMTPRDDAERPSSVEGKRQAHRKIRNRSSNDKRPEGIVSPPQQKAKSRFNNGLQDREDELNRKAAEAREKANNFHAQRKKKKKPKPQEPADNNGDDGTIDHLMQKALEAKKKVEVEEKKMEAKYEQNNLDVNVLDESFSEQPLPKSAIEQIDDQSKLSDVYVDEIKAKLEVLQYVQEGETVPPETDIAVVEAGAETALPKAEAETTVPQSESETALPEVDVEAETVLPKVEAEAAPETVLPDAEVEAETVLPEAEVVAATETGSPAAEVEATVPLPESETALPEEGQAGTGTEAEVALPETDIQAEAVLSGAGSEAAQPQEQQ